MMLKQSLSLVFLLTVAATWPGEAQVKRNAGKYGAMMSWWYETLPPFVHHGLPVLANMRAAHARGLRVAPFPIADYVWHKGRGTAARFGYGLGWRSRLDYLLHRLGF